MDKVKDSRSDWDTKEREKSKKTTKEVEITCPWVLHISKCKKDETWMVKTYTDVHKCVQTRDVKKCTSTFLSKDVEEKIIPNPKVPNKALR